MPILGSEVLNMLLWTGSTARPLGLESPIGCPPIGNHLRVKVQQPMQDPF